MSTGYDEDEAEYDPYDDAPEWTEEDEERYQARQHEEQRRKRVRRRQALSFTVLVLVVMAAGVVGAGVNQGWWEWPFGSDDDAVATTPSCDVAATLPPPSEVKVNVLNATDTRGLASAIGTELARRGYVVEKVGNEDSGVDLTGAVEVRYGPALGAQAQSAAAHFTDVQLVDDGREGSTVDVVIGPLYARMVPKAEAAAALAAATPPPAPGCGPTAPATDPSADPSAAPTPTG